MAKTGRKVKFHGAFKSKARAMRKEREVHGYIEHHTIRGSLRYIVMTRRKGK